MRILLTNDDGIEADGMCALESFLRTMPGILQVVTVAPSEERSCCGHSVNSRIPFSFIEVARDRYAVDSWPADCVRLAIRHLQFKPDVVLSGINHGGNLGVDIWMSGTCSAAREAVWLGFPAIALSQYRKPTVETDWQASAVRAWDIISKLMSRTQSNRGFWNVNLPAIASQEDMLEPVDCPAELAPLEFTLEPHSDGVLYRGSYQNRPRSTGSDVDVCFNGRPSVTFCSI